MRLFVAITPPGDALAELAGALDGLRAAAPAGLRWTPAEQWHLTLAFLGEVPDDDVPDLTGHLRAAVPAGRLGLRFAGGGCFGDRVLWVGLAGDVRAVRGLAERLCGAARDAGLDLPDRPYRPHLTVARAGRDRSDLRPAAAHLAGLVGAPWQACAVHLVRSRLGAGPGGGAVHRVTATFPLSPAG